MIRSLCSPPAAATIWLVLLGASCGDEAPPTTAQPTGTSGDTVAPPTPTPAPAPTPSDTPPAAPADGTVVIVPHLWVGPIRIGGARAEVEALGILRPHPRWSAMTLPYTAYYRDGRVFQAEVSLREVPGVRIGDTVIPRDADLARAAALLGDCTAPDLREGGTLQRCRSGGIMLNVGSAAPDELWIRTEARE